VIDLSLAALERKPWVLPDRNCGVQPNRVKNHYMWVYNGPVGKADEKDSPLTDEQIRSMLLDLTKAVTELDLDAKVLEKLLLEKGYLTESEISATLRQLTYKAKTAAKIGRAIVQRDPRKTH